MRRVTDEKLELAVGRTLQTGVLLAATVVLLGAILYLIHAPAGPREDYSHFHPAARHLRTPDGIWHGVMNGDARSVIQLGLLLLVATPVVRVMLAGVGFLLEKDRLYVWVSAIVLAVLLYSLWHIQ